MVLGDLAWSAAAAANPGVGGSSLARAASDEPERRIVLLKKKLMSAPRSDFVRVDVNQGGYITLQEWCEWLELAERRLGTPTGADLSAGWLG